MRTKNIFKHLILGATIIASGDLVGQASVLGNAANGPNDFLGWDAGGTNNFPLEIRHDGAFPIQFWTSGDFRGLINEKVTYGSLNSFPNIPADGFNLITPNDGFLQQASKGPFSRLHLAEGGEDGNAEEWGYRPWQRNGITFTGNTDQGYIGQKFREGATGETDMVIQWSDNPGVDKADRMRFIFTSAYLPGTPTGMNSEEGLEGMRLWPTWENKINVGIGDFYAYGGDPTERLHVRDGRVRIQELPDNPAADNLTRFMVVDDTPGPEYGVVKWRTLPVIPPPAASCDWTLNSSTHNNVSTAFVLLDPNCPDEGDAVGIGVNLGSAAMPSRLTVRNNTSTASMTNGLQVDVSKAGLANGIVINATSTGNSVYGMDVQATANLIALYSDAFGVRINVTGTGTQDWQSGHSIRGVTANAHGSCYVAWAGDFTADADAPYSVGVHGASTSATWHSVGVHGVSSSETVGNYGTVGEVLGDAGLIQVGLYGRQRDTGPSWINPPIGNYGLFATTEEQNDTGTDWAGWFRGNVTVTGLGYIPGGSWASSDETLKENIADIPNAMDLVMQLNPKSYDYLVDAFPQVGLPAGQQYGFIAQELEQVIPEAVKDITFQATLDSAGQEIYPALPSKIVNTNMLIPFLVAAVKEQQATIAQMQSQIDQCCAANPGMAPGGDGSLKSAPTQENVQEQRLVIHPNPFTDHTTLSYFVPQAGKVRLQVSTSDGKPLGTLREEQAEAGAFTYEWNTSRLASGTYFCTFMLDGNVVVKRAVKVAR